MRAATSNWVGSSSWDAGQMKITPMNIVRTCGSIRNGHRNGAEDEENKLAHQAQQLLRHRWPNTNSKRKQKFSEKQVNN